MRRLLRGLWLVSARLPYGDWQIVFGLIPLAVWAVAE